MTTEKKKLGWGGKRPGAGAKPKGDKAGVSHRTRAEVNARTPLLVTLRACADVDLRRAVSLAAIQESIDQIPERFELRVLRFSAKAHELRLLVRARDKRSLSRGMQSFGVRLASALNRELDTWGDVFVDRYEARALETPDAVRDATRNWD